MGFKDAEVLVKGDKTVINVEMEEEKENALDEVVVTAVGATKKINVTGAISSVDVKKLESFATSNLSNTLGGNVPGIIAMQSSGKPGQNTTQFWIRGISTFGASSSAYILVDGFERSDIDQINIEDIESFSVLKDASATAIYGTKGANGVILITTKHGQAGKLNINAKYECSYNTRTITPEFEDGYTYAKLLNEACITRNKEAHYTSEELDLIRTGLDPDLYPNVDWKEQVLKDGAFSHRANINFSGGGSAARYYASVSFINDGGMYKTDKTLRSKYNTNANYNRWNYRLNVDFDLTKTTVIKLGVSGYLDLRNSPGLGDTDTWHEIFGYTPLTSPIFYSDGSIPAVGSDNLDMNPWVSATQTGYNKVWNNNIQTNATLEQDFNFLIKGLKFIGRFGFDTYNNNWIHHRLHPEMYKATGRDMDGKLVLIKVFNKTNMTQEAGGDGSRREFVDLMMNWHRTFLKKHNLGATLKYTQNAKNITRGIGTDIKNSVPYKNISFAGQATYNYDQRYFLDFNFGYNGSENFADHHRFGFFPAFSAAWNVAEEKFIMKSMPWLNMFKIRYSRGKVGNDNTGTRFPYLYTLGETSGTVYSWGTNDHPHSFNGIHYTQVASPFVTWEVAHKSDLGVDLIVFENMFSFTMDYFHEKRTGIYMQRKYLPQIVGLESNPRANVGKSSSRGFDGNFAFKKHFGEVGVTLRGNITYTKNRVDDYDEELKVYPYQYTKGYRINQQKGLIALGLFKDYDDIRNSPKQTWGSVQPGDIKYMDVNGDGYVNDGDRVAIGATSVPNLIYGLAFSVDWKGFDFNVHFQGAGKSTFPIGGKCVYAFSEGTWGNIIKGMLDDRWISADISGDPSTENPNASYPRLTFGGNSNNQQVSSFWLRDGRYLRLKNVDIGYTIPKVLVNKLRISSIRVYVSGQNLHTWSKFKYWDPETLSRTGEVYPLLKSITMGIQVKL